jgi:hypothetical protein
MVVHFVLLECYIQRRRRILKTNVTCAEETNSWRKVTWTWMLQQQIEWEGTESRAWWHRAALNGDTVWSEHEFTQQRHSLIRTWVHSMETQSDQNISLNGDTVWSEHEFTQWRHILIRTWVHLMETHSDQNTSSLNGDTVWSEHEFTQCRHSPIRTWVHSMETQSDQNMSSLNGDTVWSEHEFTQWRQSDQNMSLLNGDTVWSEHEFTQWRYSLIRTWVFSAAQSLVTYSTLVS